MPTPRDHALTIKGFLQASHAPVELLSGIEQVIEALQPDGISMTFKTDNIPPSTIAELAQKFIHGRAAALDESHKSLPKPSNQAKNKGEPPPAPHAAAPDVTAREQSDEKQGKITEITPSGNISEKKPRKMSEEARAAISASMKARHAARRKEKEELATTIIADDEENPPFESRAPAAPKTGIFVKDVKPNPEWHSNAHQHHGYAGKREDGLLNPGDLVDIRDMIEKQMALEEIAQLYSVSVSELESFLNAHENVKITKIKPPPFQGAIRRF